MPESFWPPRKRGYNMDLVIGLVVRETSKDKRPVATDSFGNCKRSAGNAVEGNMDYDMHSASLVQDIGDAVPMPPFVQYTANPRLHARNMVEMLACIRDFLARAGLPAVATINNLNDYFQAMSLNRAFGITGTTPGNGTIWLFFLARALQPKIIVESGVFHGSSLFTFSKAVPETKIFAFDLDFSTLLSRLEGVDYREYDWRTVDIRAESPSDLCFFDDHINNCMRIRQSYERGFRHVVLDDSPDVGEIHKFRYPAVPTISMIENDKWADGDTLEWNWQERRLRYTFRTEDTFGAKDLIEAIYRFPSLTRWTGMEDAFHYYVRLKASS
jgi:hypothetical protein